MSIFGNTHKSSIIKSAEDVNTKTNNSGSGWTGNTWTGQWELSDRDYVRSSVLCDVSGTVFFEFGYDGATVTSTFPTAGFPLSTFHEYHGADLSGRWFRVRVVLDSAPTNVDIHTYFSDNPPSLNSPLSQSVSTDQDATTVKAVLHGEDISNPGTFVQSKMTTEGAPIVATTTSMIHKLFQSTYIVDVDSLTDRIDYYDTTSAGTRVAYRTITYDSTSKTKIISNVVTNL